MAANGRGGMRPAGRSPPFLLIGLTVALFIVGFNYWNVSSRNNVLSVEIGTLRDQIRSQNAIRLTAEKRSEEVASKIRDCEEAKSQITEMFEDKKMSIGKKETEINEKKSEIETLKNSVSRCESNKVACDNDKLGITEENQKLKVEIRELKSKSSVAMPNCDSACKDQVENIVNILTNSIGKDTIKNALSQNGVHVDGLTEQLANQASINQKPNLNEQDLNRQPNQDLNQPSNQGLMQQPNQGLIQQENQGFNQQGKLGLIQQEKTGLNQEKLGLNQQENQGLNQQENQGLKHQENQGLNQQENKDLNQQENKDLNQHKNVNFNQDLNQQPSHNFNQPSNQDTNQQPNQESNQQPNQDENQQPSQDANQQPNQGSNQRPIQSVNGQPSQDLNQQGTNQQPNQGLNQQSNQGLQEQHNELPNKDLIQQHKQGLNQGLNQPQQDSINQVNQGTNQLPDMRPLQPLNLHQNKESYQENQQLSKKSGSLVGENQQNQPAQVISGSVVSGGQVNQDHNIFPSQNQSDPHKIMDSLITTGKHEEILHKESPVLTAHDKSANQIPTVNKNDALRNRNNVAEAPDFKDGSDALEEVDDKRMKPIDNLVNGDRLGESSNNHNNPASFHASYSPNHINNLPNIPAPNHLLDQSKIEHNEVEIETMDKGKGNFNIKHSMEREGKKQQMDIDGPLDEALEKQRNHQFKEKNFDAKDYNYIGDGMDDDYKLENKQNHDLKFRSLQKEDSIDQLKQNIEDKEPIQ